MKAFVVFNYASGKGKCQEIAPVVKRILYEEGIDYTVFETVDKETDIKTIRENINKNHFLICAGGDGTVNEVLNAVVAEDSHTPVGYIPCGSTNDFAANYSLTSDPKQAMERILHMHKREIDVGCLNGSCFCYVSAAGAFSEVSYATSRQKKNMLGKAAYILEGAKSIPKIKSISLRAETNGEVFEGNYLICTFSNSSRIGGIFKFSDGMVDYSDGKMELALIEDPMNPAEFIILLGDLMRGNYQNKYIHVIRTDHVKITSEQPISWSLDGEFGGSFNETEISTLGHRFSLLC